MVMITENWQAFREYAEKCRLGTYQMKDVPEGKEIRVRAGRLGIIKVFDPDDKRSESQQQTFQEMVSFCMTQGFILITETLPDELFHV